MKCYRASPYGEFVCQLEKGHEGSCFDGMNSFTENINGLGRDLILDINKEFHLNIPITEETTKAMSNIADDNIDAIVDTYELGNCSDCDQRRGEPMHNEGYD